MQAGKSELEVEIFFKQVENLVTEKVLMKNALNCFVFNTKMLAK